MTDTLPAEAIEAVAEALYTADYHNGEPFAKYPVGSHWGDRYRSEARAALLAAQPHLARLAAVPSEQEPVAYLIEDSPVRGIRAIVWPGELQRAMEEEPQAKTTPLYAHPAPAAGVKVKPPKWHHEVAIGASTPEEWFATTPEGKSLTVTYDESCELPWVARPFPPGPSNYATADEAKAALEAAREDRIRRALDTGEPK